jgi:integrase
MPRRARGITTMTVRHAAPGRHYDGDGLVLLIRDGETAYWEYHYTVDDRRRVMGLGRARGRNPIGLAEVREKVADLRRQVKAGEDPLAKKHAARRAAKAAAQQAALRLVSFRTAAGRYIDSHSAGWKNTSKSALQWLAGFRQHVFPAFGDIPVGDIGKAEVLGVLEPLWRTKPDVASRLRARIAAVLDYAKARGWRSGDNPAEWRGNLNELLPKASKVRGERHHAALPWHDLPAFMAKLRALEDDSALVLGFCILTAARSGEARGARWAEVDLTNRTWTVPAARMKAGRTHRVPLSDEAMLVLRMAIGGKTPAANSLIFPGRRSGLPLTDAALLMVVRRITGAGLTVHGFRSTFRDWAAEYASAPRELAEAALAHAVGDRTEAAYFRSDLFERRRKLMESWGIFCTHGEVADSEKVVPMRSGTHA